MNISVLNTTSDPSSFFDVLAPDWRNEIEPIWNDYKNSSTIYTIHADNKVLGGGILFTKITPDMEYASEEANYWFSGGYIYQAFIFIDEKYRGNNLGSKWLQEVIRQNPQSKFFLTIEDLSLENFYLRNGYTFQKKLFNDGNEERLYVYEPKH